MKKTRENLEWAWNKQLLEKCCFSSAYFWSICVGTHWPKFTIFSCVFSSSSVCVVVVAVETTISDGKSSISRLIHIICRSKKEKNRIDCILLMNSVDQSQQNICSFVFRSLIKLWIKTQTKKRVFDFVSTRVFRMFLSPWNERNWNKFAFLQFIRCSSNHQQKKSMKMNIEFRLFRRSWIFEYNFRWVLPI